MTVTGQMMRRWLWCALMVLALWPTMAAAQEYRTRNQPLNVLNAAVWASPSISVCWLNNGSAAEKSMVRDAVAKSWEAASAVRFTGWRTGCSRYDMIRIAIADDRPHVTALGRSLANAGEKMVLNFTFNTFVPSCKANATQRERCIRAIAVHEFGHALGFAHENLRVDGFCDAERNGTMGDQVVGVWDLNSTMNYCASNWYNTTLTAGDIEGVQTIYGMPKYATVTLPSGGWKNSCKDASANLTLLVATCKAKDGRFYRTGLPSWRGCTRGIANLDGRLGCPSSQPIPAGGWRSSCRDAVVQGQMLAATCKNKGGNWRRTQLGNFAGCNRNTLSNDDGVLQCTRGNPPAGSYRNSCRNVSLAGTLLNAECRDGNGGTRNSGIKRSDLCRSAVRNSRGQLTCLTSSPQPRGSWRSSCADSFMDDGDLVAQCKVGRTYTPSRLVDVAACPQAVRNAGGVLKCRP